MNYSPAFPKPGQMKRKERPAFKTYPDGREVCLDTPKGKAEYKRRITEMWERQGEKCGLMITALCKILDGFMTLAQATFEHVDGRGMSGAKRDDRIEKNGKPYNLAACIFCNQEKGSRKLDQLLEQEMVP